jgi:hypothetical protein
LYIPRKLARLNGSSMIESVCTNSSPTPHEFTECDIRYSDAPEALMKNNY